MIEEKNIFGERYYSLLEQIKDLSKYSEKELQELLENANAIHDEYENLQLVVKCNGNSLYGVSASRFFSLHDVDIAEDITTTAKHYAIIVDRGINRFFTLWSDSPESLQKMQEFKGLKVLSIRNFTEYQPDTKHDICVYGDTDSRYLDIEQICNLITVDIDGVAQTMQVPDDTNELVDFVNFMMENFIQKIIGNVIEAECEYRNGRKGYLKMAHEVTAKKCIFLKKKKYVMVLVWKDGKILSKEKMKYQGVEIKKGSQSPKSKKLLQKLLENNLLKNYDTQKLRKDTIALINLIKSKKQKDFIYLVSSVSYGSNDIYQREDGKWYSNKNHIQMQMLLSWLNFVADNKLEQEYKPPFSGQKMNYYYTKDSKYKVIAVPDDIDINDVKGLPEPDWNKMYRK